MGSFPTMHYVYMRWNQVKPASWTFDGVQTENAESSSQETFYHWGGTGGLVLRVTGALQLVFTSSPVLVCNHRGFQLVKQIWVSFLYVFHTQKRVLCWRRCACRLCCNRIVPSATLLWAFPFHSPTILGGCTCHYHIPSFCWPADTLRSHLEKEPVAALLLSLALSEFII